MSVNVARRARKARISLVESSLRNSHANFKAGVGHAGFETPQVTHEFGRNLIACEVPVDGAEFGLNVEAKPLINRDDTLVADAQAMTALPVGIVGDRVEKSQRLQSTAKMRFLVEREEVVVLIRFDEQLDGAYAMRAFSRKTVGGNRFQPSSSLTR